MKHHAFAEVVAACVLAAVGSAFAVPTLENLAEVKPVCGKALAPEDVAGRVALVYEWNVAGENSKALLPRLEKVWQSYRTKRFVLVGVHLGKGEDAEIAAAAKAAGVTFPVYTRASGFPLCGQAKSVPHFLVFSSGLRVLYGGTSEREAEGAAVNALSDTGIPDDLVTGVALKHFKGMKNQLKFGKNVESAAKKLEKATTMKSTKPEAKAEAQAILAALAEAKARAKQEVALMARGDAAEGYKALSQYLKTWPSEAAEYRGQLAELKKKAAEAKAAKASAKGTTKKKGTK